jgi:hypothetical protein
MPRLVVKTASLSMFWEDDIILPFSGNISFGGASFVLNVSIDANNNLTIKNANTGVLVVPQRSFPQGSSTVFVVNGSGYVLYNLPDNSPIETGEGFGADVGVKTGFPQGNWDAVSWNNFNWG